MLPNLSITKHDFNLECKQTWSGNKVHTYTRVNEGVGGIREAQTIIDLQNDFNILVAKQWKIRISVPMSYIYIYISYV